MHNEMLLFVSRVPINVFRLLCFLCCKLAVARFEAISSGSQDAGEISHLTKKSYISQPQRVVQFAEQ